MPAHPEDSPVASEAEATARDLPDFSLVGGGLLYQLLRRTRLCGDALELTPRRVLLMILIIWVPLLLLSAAEGHAWGGGVALTFLQDIETHVRLLVTAPLLILAEVRVHRKLPRIVRLFVENGLIRDEARPQFDAAIASALRLRNSVVPELLLIVFVYGVSMPFIWGNQFAIDLHSWYATTVDGRLQPSGAGLWFVYVSMPVLQFLLLRWYFRFFIWARLLWQVRRTRLNLEPAHPDCTAGLLFLARTGRIFSLVPLAIGSALAGFLANRIFYTGATLPEFKVEIVGTVAVLVLLVLGPLTMFEPQLRATRRRGMIEYGTFGQIYAREFHRKWIRGPHPSNEPLLGSADIQSLADLRNSFDTVRGIRLVPFTLSHVTALAITTLLPIAPLLLTMFSVEQLLDRVLKSIL